MPWPPHPTRQALSSSLDDLDRQEDEELIAAAAATEGRKLTAKGKGRASTGDGAEIGWSHQFVRLFALVGGWWNFLIAN